MFVRIVIALIALGFGVFIVGGPAGVVIAIIGLCAACWPKRRYHVVVDDDAE